MAIAFKSSSEATTAVISLTVSFPAPSGITEDDILIGLVSTNYGQAAGITAPEGWVEIFQSADTGNTGDENRLAVFYKIATIYDESEVSYAFNWTDTSTAACGGIALYSGVSTSDPIDVSGVATGLSAIPTSPDITTSRSDSMILRMYGCDAAGGGRLPVPETDTYPPSTFGRFAIESTLLEDSAVALADEDQPLAGSTGTAEFVLDVADTWVAGTVALNNSLISSSSSSGSSSSSSSSMSSSSSSSSSSVSSSSSSDLFISAPIQLPRKGVLL